MALDYTKLWKLLIDRGLTKTELRQLAGISSRTLAKLSKNENVNTDTISSICRVLSCDVGDIMEYTENKMEMTVYDYYRENGVVTENDENHRVVSIDANGQSFNVYFTLQKATKASHIHCKSDGTIVWEQLYPFGGVGGPSRVISFMLKPKTERGVITVVVISGKPGIITGLDEDRCKSHKGKLKNNDDFFVMSETAFKRFRMNTAE